MTKTKEEKQKELQDKYMELQTLKQQISALVEQRQAVEEKEAEIKTTIDSLKNLKTVKKGEEMWSSLGSSTFVGSNMGDAEKVLVAVGAGVVIKENVAKAVEILEGRAKDINAIGIDIVGQANKFMENVTKLEPEIQKLAQELQ